MKDQFRKIANQFELAKEARLLFGAGEASEGAEVEGESTDIVHTVEPKQGLSHIVREYTDGLSKEDFIVGAMLLKRENNILNANIITLDQKIKVPGDLQGQIDGMEAEQRAELLAEFQKDSDELEKEGVRALVEKQLMAIREAGGDVVKAAMPAEPDLEEGSGEGLEILDGDELEAFKTAMESSPFPYEEADIASGRLQAFVNTCIAGNKGDKNSPDSWREVIQGIYNKAEPVAKKAYDSIDGVIEDFESRIPSLIIDHVADRKMLVDLEAWKTRLQNHEDYKESDVDDDDSDDLDMAADGDVAEGVKEDQEDLLAEEERDLVAEAEAEEASAAPEPDLSASTEVDDTDASRASEAQDSADGMAVEGLKAQLTEAIKTVGSELYSEEGSHQSKEAAKKSLEDRLVDKLVRKMFSLVVKQGNISDERIDEVKAGVRDQLVMGEAFDNSVKYIEEEQGIFSARIEEYSFRENPEPLRKIASAISGVITENNIGLDYS